MADDPHDESVTDDPEQPSQDEYELAIDAQVEKFVETKQKLTYFLVTASAVSIAFVAKFFVDTLWVKQKHQSAATRLESHLVILAAVAGLITAGLALLNLRLEHKSYERHLGFRYQRKNWESLTETEQKDWDRLNKWASRSVGGAFLFLFVEVGLAVAFFVALFW